MTPSDLRALALQVDAFESRQLSAPRPAGVLVVVDWTEAPPQLQSAARQVSAARDPRKRESSIREARRLRAQAGRHSSLARCLDQKGQSVSAAKLRAKVEAALARSAELEASLL